MLGCARQVRYFAECVLQGTPPDRTDLRMAPEMAKVYQRINSYRHPYPSGL